MIKKSGLKHIIFLLLFFVSVFFTADPGIYASDVPAKRVVAEWEPALGVMIRWPLGIPPELVVELSRANVIYVLVDNTQAQNSAMNAFNSWGINPENVEYVFTNTYSHWTRDYGPQFLIDDDSWQVVNQYFNGYPTEPGCFICNEGMERYDCNGFKFCNDQPIFPGYDCFVNDGTCEDITGDGQINDMLGDGYCDNGNYGFNFRCDEYGWDCGDCGDEIVDPNGYCDDMYYNSIYFRYKDTCKKTGRPLPDLPGRDFSDDDDTNIDFAMYMGWDLIDLPLFFTGGNFMTDGYGMAFCTKLMLNENNMWLDEFRLIADHYLGIWDFHIIDNPNLGGIQHIDCNAKLLNAETVIIKQVNPDNPEYQCMEELAEYFSGISTFYGWPFKIHRIYCPDLSGPSWEENSTAAYVNSLILNDRVYIPLYGIDEDEYAMQAYRDAMPGYEVLGFYHTSWYGEDALHCRTIGIFDPDMVHISHASIRNEEISRYNPVLIEAQIIDYSGTGIEEHSVQVKWRYDSEEEWNTETMVQVIGSNIYQAEIGHVNPFNIVHYYIKAVNNMGKSSSHPPAGWHSFTASGTSEGVLLDHFSAYGSGNQANIEWKTLSEANLMGWNVYRIIGKKVNPFISYAPVKLNTSPIPGQGGYAEPWTYGFSDIVKPGGIYIYLLEAIFSESLQEWRTRLIWQ